MPVFGPSAPKSSLSNTSIMFDELSSSTVATSSTANGTFGDDTVTVTVAVSHVAVGVSSSHIVYVNVSSPLKPGAGT